MILTREIIFTKQGIDIKRVTEVCDDCGVDMVCVGSAGCPHENSYTYFYQCKNCKMVQSNDMPPRADYDEFIAGGWTVKNEKAEKNNKESQ